LDGIFGTVNTAHSCTVYIAGVRGICKYGNNS